MSEKKLINKSKIITKLILNLREKYNLLSNSSIRQNDNQFNELKSKNDELMMKDFNNFTEKFST